METLNKIKTRFREETFTRENIREVIQSHPELVRMLYINFAMVHCMSLFLPPTMPLDDWMRPFGESARSIGRNEPTKWDEISTI